MDKLRRRKDAEASSLARMGTAILKGNRLGVKWLPDGSDELGYTSGREKVVNIAWFHEFFMKSLSDIEQSAMRMGIFAHELLHQCLTNFKYTNEALNELSQAEAAIAMEFCNTLEDPAIEYFAPNIFGGKLLNALRFNIKHVYKMSPGIDESPTAFTQLINALIYFGDMGIVKGSFTFPEAYEYFVKVAPLYNKGITCPDSRKRIDIALECMEITRPLWEEEVKDRERLQELIEKMMKGLETSGPHLMEDEEKSMGAPESKAEEKRAETLKKVKPRPDADPESDSDEAEAEAGTDTDAETGDETDSSGKGKPSVTASAEDPDSGHEEGTEDGEDGEQEDIKPDGTPGGSSPHGSEKPLSPEDVTESEDDANEAADSVYDVDEDKLKDIEEMIKNEEARIGREENAEKSSGPEELPEYDISSPEYKSATCSNHKVTAASDYAADLYSQAVSKYKREINGLYKALDQVFKSDMEERCRATSGSYNIMRGSVGTTARMFDKRRDPANLKDAAVVLAVDMSGSMYGGTKMQQARKTAIVFAEALSKLKIPYYIMGFTADITADADHYHFVDWRGLKKDRQTLITMEPMSNNFDGYSIRYAANLLRDRPAGNKLLIVISDGEPACRKYNGSASGINDTINAIKDARRYCTTFGIAVGMGCSPRILQSMYGRDFIYCEDETLLSNMLGKKLAKLFESRRK